jgi:nitrite reductase/ring-hydroxylating ferredoxin subunit
MLEEQHGALVLLRWASGLECTVCHWHGSEFGLDDLHVINGPATQNQPCLDVRERAGEIEIREGFAG